MSEAQWSPDPSEAPKKKSFPKWVWFCGGGCLLALLVGIVALVFVGNWIKKATDPELIEPALQKVLPHDELPPEMHFQMYNSVGIEQFTLVDSRGFQLQIQVHYGDDGANARKQMFEKEEPEFPKDLGVMKFEDLRKTEVEVQGRTLHALHMKMEFTGILGSVMPDEAKNQLGSMLFLDVTPESAPGAEEAPTLVLLQLMRMKKAGEITDDELRDLLKPFHIGAKR